ncbi:MAG: cobyrinate a,c-diamide synthase [Gammaproteobacteria bacterium]|nr:cobyrinate a,c-diamide synthase [Gammaproteobacteria bacterium]
MTGFYLSAAHKSSGKTMLSIGLSAAFRERQLSVQCFKKGPDYIDPIWLSLAAGNPCQNLDFYTSSKEFIRAQFHHYGVDNQVILVEGNKGLHDGISVDGSDSNAAMAKLLNLPVVLVIDTAGITRGIAPLLQGYINFDPEIDIAGVILNKVGGRRHTAKLINAVENYTDLPVFGAITRDPSLALCERHLGLVPGNEIGDDASILIEKWRQQVEKEIDLEALLKLGPPRQPQTDIQFFQSARQSRLRIAIARDAVFGFYYAADLERFAALGVDLVNFDTTRDKLLPDNIDGLFIGGGFPETNLHSISRNTSLLLDIKQKIESGLPTYAECGGLMYLCRRISYKGQCADVAGVIPADVMMHDKPQGRGYVKLEAGKKHPWCDQHKSTEIHAHEFHYSTLTNCEEPLKFGYRITRGQGIDGINDGIICYNLLASYSHLRHTDSCPWVDQFINFVSICKSENRYDYNQQECSHTN